LKPSTARRPRRCPRRSSICPGSSPSVAWWRQASCFDASPPAWSPPNSQTMSPLRPAGCSLRGTTAVLDAPALPQAFAATASMPGGRSAAGNASKRAIGPLLLEEERTEVLRAGMRQFHQVVNACPPSHGNRIDNCSPISTRRVPCVFRSSISNERNTIGHLDSQALRPACAETLRGGA